MIALAAAVIDQRTDIGRQSGFGPTLPAFDAPVTGGGGEGRRNIVVTFGTKKLEWFGYLMVETF